LAGIDREEFGWPVTTWVKHRRVFLLRQSRRNESRQIRIWRAAERGQHDGDFCIERHYNAAVRQNDP
jgi:hypothetical protein